jgi:hypothetical protein
MHQSDFGTREVLTKRAAAARQIRFTMYNHVWSRGQPDKLARGNRLRGLIQNRVRDRLAFIFRVWSRLSQ